jgi:hypothetical protein
MLAGLLPRIGPSVFQGIGIVLQERPGHADPVPWVRVISGRLVVGRQLAQTSICAPCKVRRTPRQLRGRPSCKTCWCHGLPPVSDITRAISISVQPSENSTACGIVPWSVLILSVVIVSKLVRFHQHEVHVHRSFLPNVAGVQSQCHCQRTSVQEDRATTKQHALTWKHPCSRHASAISWMTSTLVAAPMLSRLMLMTGNARDDSYDPLGGCSWLSMYAGEKHAGPPPETPK